MRAEGRSREGRREAMCVNGPVCALAPPGPQQVTSVITTVVGPALARSRSLLSPHPSYLLQIVTALSPLPRAL